MLFNNQRGCGAGMLALAAAMWPKEKWLNEAGAALDAEGLLGSKKGWDQADVSIKLPMDNPATASQD